MSHSLRRRSLSRSSTATRCSAAAAARARRIEVSLEGGALCPGIRERVGEASSVLVGRDEGRAVELARGPQRGRIGVGGAPLALDRGCERPRRTGEALVLEGGLDAADAKDGLEPKDVPFHRSTPLPVSSNSPARVSSRSDRSASVWRV